MRPHSFYSLRIRHNIKTISHCPRTYYGQQQNEKHKNDASDNVPPLCCASAKLTWKSKRIHKFRENRIGCGEINLNLKTPPTTWGPNKNGI